MGIDLIVRRAELREELYAAIMEARRWDAVAILRAQSELSGHRAVISEILEPTLKLIGERWSLDRISLAQAYVAGKIAEDMLSLVADEKRALNETASFSRGRVIVCNAEDDYHSLGRRMVSAFLRLDGWDVVDLGNDVLANDLVNEAQRIGASVVGVSAMMLTNARNIAKVREELDRRELSASIKLAVGGAVFVMRPELVAEVGGDGSAATAMEASALFERLAGSAIPAGLSGSTS
jgi:methanogenic corrinoid protein MtbC1